MAILKDSDLFPFDEYEARLKGLEVVTQHFAESTVSWLDRIKSTSNATEKEIADIAVSIQQVSVSQKNAGNVLADYSAKLDLAGAKLELARQSEKDLTDAQKLNAQVVTDLTNKLLGLKQRLDSLDPTQKDYQKQQRAILNEVRMVTRAIEAQSKSLQVGKSALDAAEDSVALLRKQTTELKRSLDTLPGAYNKATGEINQQNRAAVALNEQYQKNIALLSKVEQGQRNFRGQVGNYALAQNSQQSGPNVAGMALSMGRGIAGAGLALAGIDSTIAAITKVGDITLQFDSLDSALKVVSNDTALFTQRQAMLKQVSDDLGQDLAIVERGYTNLTASSKGTRLEGVATDKIFQQVVGTMGRLKKSGEETDGALLAIGQMMSKGTVQSEELRGQLGERIPGAFNIMARALGVTTQKLGDMLKNGEVLAADVLPKFADELERTFNPNNERRVEGLAANMARLRNEGVEWVKGLDIGDATGRFIGNITSMARAIRQFFSSAVDQSTQSLAEQADRVNQLETALPKLLSRYDELYNKSQLSTKEQKELQEIVNQIANLVPSAVTGFDNYGNALDINKSKVMSFTAAQRELNAELNKAAISALKDQTQGGMDRAAQTQATLNRGTKQASFNFKPYFLQSAEERKQATSKDAGKRREVSLSDDERRTLASQLQAENKQIELSIIQRLQLGDKLSEADKKYINFSNNDNLKRVKVVEDYNVKIAELDAKQANLFIKGDKDSLKKREAVLSDLKVYKDKVRAILNPSLGEKPAATEKPGLSEAQLNKAKAAAEKALRDGLSLSKATADRNLTKLNDDKQDGLIDEQTFIEKRLQITLKGLNERQSLLEKAGKKETDDYLNVLREKEKADTDYKRAQLQLDIKANKSSTDKNVAGLDVQHGEGGLTDLSYEDKRHTALKEGLKREQAIIEEGGQQESQLFRDNQQKQLDEQADYLRRRLVAEKKAWKESFTEARDALRLINATEANALDNQLQDLEKYYNQKENQVKLDIARKKVSPVEGEAKLYDLQMQHLKDQATAFEASYIKDRRLSDALVNDKIEALKNYRDYAMLTPAEIEEANERIRQLENEREKDAAEDKKKLDKEVADNGIAQSDRETKHKLTNEEKAKGKREAYLQMSLQLAGTIGDSIFSIISSNNERESQALDRQQENELKLAGDNVDAKTRIEEQYAKKKAELARKAAIAEREQALFSIAINTAMGVASVLSTGGGAHYADFGISAGILTAFVVAAGIAQAAAVLAKPLPAFWMGTSSAPEGYALVGDRGPELRQKKDGTYQYYDKPTIDYLNAGDRIYTASQTAQMVADWQKQEAAQQALQESMLYGQTTSRLQNGRREEQVIIHQLANANNRGLSFAEAKQAFGEALDDRPFIQYEFHKDFIDESQGRGNSRVTHRERRYRLPS